MFFDILRGPAAGIEVESPKCARMRAGGLGADSPVSRHAAAAVIILTAAISACLPAEVIARDCAWKDAGGETENQADETTKFQGINPTYIVASPGNVTPGGNEVIRLNVNNKVGPGKSIKVYPGDVINATVYSYYTTSGGFTKTPLAAMGTAVAGAFGGVQSAIGDPGAIFSNVTQAYTPAGIAGLSPDRGATNPSAFINYILFDKEFKPLAGESKPITATPNAPQLLTMTQVSVQEMGYLYIYLSYDNLTGADVYFDDLRITHQESPVIQVNNYYPFGLVSYAWLREGEIDNANLFQGKELIAQTGWHDFGSRMYWAELGRWFGNDPQGGKMPYMSNYASMMNNPVAFTDPDGECPICPFLIGALFGGLSGAASGAQLGLSGLDLVGHIFGSAVIGGITGAVGSAVQSSIGAATFGSHLLSYTASGIVTGGIGGGFGSALAGGDFWEGAKQGAVIGGIAGFATGAIFGGIDYGQRVSAARKSLMASGVNPNAPVNVSNADLNGFVQNNQTLSALDAQGGNPTYQVASASNLPAGNSMQSGLIRDANGNLAGGLTEKIQSTYNATSHGFRSNIWIAPARFSKAFKLFMTVGHELNHAVDYYGGNFYSWYEAFRLGSNRIPAGYSTDYNLLAGYRSEVAAHTWSQSIARQFRYQAFHYQNQIGYYRDLLPFFPR